MASVASLALLGPGGCDYFGSRRVTIDGIVVHAISGPQSPISLGTSCGRSYGASRRDWSGLTPTVRPSRLPAYGRDGPGAAGR